MFHAAFPPTWPSPPRKGGGNHSPPSLESELETLEGCGDISSGSGDVSGGVSGGIGSGYGGDSGGVGCGGGGRVVLVVFVMVVVVILVWSWWKILSKIWLSYSQKTPKIFHLIN